MLSYNYDEFQADKEKKKKTKKKEEPAPPPPEPEPAPPAEEKPPTPTGTPKESGSTRASSRGSRKAKRTGSSVFSMFTQKQVAEFKEVHTGTRDDIRKSKKSRSLKMYKRNEPRETE